MFKRGLEIFWRALRANLIPAIGIWTMGAVLVYAYYHGTLVSGVAEEVLQLRDRLGLVYPIISMTVFGAILPMLTLMAIRPSDFRLISHRLILIIPFWAYKGIEVEYFYKLQAWLWGNDPTFIAVVGKVATDQFIYNPCGGAISLILYHRWVARKTGELPPETQIFPKNWYTLLVVPLLVATWALWIPAVSFVYMMPTALQLPLANLILWLWSMMLVFMAKDEAK